MYYAGLQWNEAPPAPQHIQPDELALVLYALRKAEMINTPIYKKISVLAKYAEAQGHRVCELLIK